MSALAEALPEPALAVPWVPWLQQGQLAGSQLEKAQQREASRQLGEQQVLRGAVQVCRLQEQAVQAWPAQQARRAVPEPAQYCLEAAP